jgi:tetratricopeptide (TPR) repeat protein
MKKIISVAVFLLLSLIKTSEAHKEWVHQYVAQEAYTFLKNMLGYEIPDLKDHIGFGFYGYGDDDDPWATGYVGVGAWREDREDIVWLHGGAFDGWDPSCTHFWNADNGDDCTTPISGSGNVQNAWTKARIFLFGGHRILFAKVTIDSELNQVIFGRYYSYNSLADFFTTGHCYSEGYVDMSYNSHFWAPEEHHMNLESARKRAYEILGHVAHLLADMGVPAHIHDDMHPCDTGDPDGYELYMSGNDWFPTVCNDPKTSFPAQNWTSSTAATQGGLIDISGLSDFNAMRYLFYTQNQLADHFPSGTPSDIQYSGDNNLPNGSNSYLLQRYQAFGNPPSNLNYQNIANECFNFTIRATATLYYWFAMRAGLIPIRVPQDYSTLQQALASAISSNTIEICSNMTLSTSSSIPAGITLYIPSGVTVNLNGYSVITTSGTITTQSGANVTGARLLNLNAAIIGLYPTIQSALNAATGDQAIYVPSGTYNENISASNKSNLTITGAGVNNTTINGTLTFYSCYNLQLSASFWCSGENLTLCDFGNFHSSVAGASSQIGAALYYCYNFDLSGTIIDCSASGLYSCGSTGAVLSNAYFISNVTGITSNTGGNVDVVGSHFCTSVSWDFNSGARGSIHAYSCYYPNGIARYYTSRGGIVGISGSNWCTSSSELSADPKIRKELISSVQSQSDDSTDAAFSKINTSYFSLMKAIKTEVKKNELSNNGQLHADYLGVLKDFRAFIKNNPESPLAAVALITVANGYGVFGDYEEMKNLLNEIIVGSKPDQLKDVARDLMVDYYRKTKDYDGAISAADAFVKDCKGDSDLVADVLFKKGLILHYEQSLPEQAASCFLTIVQNYSGTGAANFAANELKVLATETPKASEEKVSVDNISGIMLSNYPNPFNPTTVIGYQLSVSGHVTLKVYDILGREVTTLVNESQNPGIHSATFDASRLASGVYFYRLTAPGVNQVKKMLLTK